MGFLQKQEVLLIGCRCQCLDQRDGVIGFYFFISLPFVKIKYLKHSAARGRHIIKRGDCRGRERAGPGPVRWTLEQGSAVKMNAL